MREKQGGEKGRGGVDPAENLIFGVGNNDSIYCLLHKRCEGGGGLHKEDDPKNNYKKLTS